MFGVFQGSHLGQLLYLTFTLMMSINSSNERLNTHTHRTTYKKHDARFNHNAVIFRPELSQFNSHQVDPTRSTNSKKI